MNQAFSEFGDMVDYLESMDAEAVKIMFPTSKDLENMRQTFGTVSDASASTIRVLEKELDHLRGKPYGSMSFDDRFELMKWITRRAEIPVHSFEKLHLWMLKGEDDLILTQSQLLLAEQPSPTTRRIRTITISCFRHQGSGNYPCLIRLSSSPVGEYVSGRFKQKFGADSMLNVKFEFKRMGVPSHLYLHTQFGDETFTAYEEDQYPNFQSTRFFNLMRSIYPDVVECARYYKVQTLDDTSKNTAYDHHHKIKIQQEMFSFYEIGKYLEKDLNILGCKFSVLCQNLSGMHSYKYVYFCPNLSTGKLNDTPLTIEKVRDWAIPKHINKDLFDAEKKNKLYLRISLFNTPVIPTVSVENFKVQQDIGGFTDGCGYISPQLAEYITKCIKKYLMEHYSAQSSHFSESDQYNKDLLDTSLSNTTFQSLPNDYVPSAFQIRFLGAKGMLCVKEGLFEKEGCHLVLHESMVKVLHDKDKSDEILQKVQVVGYSSPSGNAHLTLTVIHLLNGCSDDSGIIQKKIMDSMHDMVDSVITSHLQASVPDIVKNQVKNNDFASLGVLSATKDKKMAFLTGCYRSNLMEMKFPLKKTRRLYGVADPYGILDEGQVYINITSNNRPLTLNQEIIITKEPCLHRGDLRKVKAVQHIEELSHLTDVIVFPTRSKDNRPIPNTIAGSDLDGDEYFVCWDQDIVDHCIQFAPAPSDDMIEKQKFEKYTSFEPDAFKYWIGIRMAFADFFDKEWTSEENWNSTMSILCDVLNSAIDAPKQGSIVTKKEQLQNIITNFPGFPHYMNKASGGTRQSTSLIGKMFDEMNNRITKILGYTDINAPSSLDIPLLDNRLTTTTLDCQKYLWLLFFHFCQVESLLGDYTNFTNFICKIIRNGQANILLASEFLSTFWRGVGISINEEVQDEMFYCFLKEKITNLPEFVIEKLSSIISGGSKVFFSNGLLFDVSKKLEDPSSSNHFQIIIDNNLCTIFKISNWNYPSNFYNSIILKDCMQRLRIPPEMYEKKRVYYGGVHPANYDMMTFIDYTSSNNHEKDSDFLPRFNFFQLCGFGSKEKEFKETKLDKIFSTICAYIFSNTFDGKDSIRTEIGTPLQCEQYYNYLRSNMTSMFIYSSGNTEHIHYQEEKQKEFFKMLATNSNLTKIVRLFLSDQRISDSVLGEIMDSPYIYNITYLDIRENEITDEGIVKVFGKMLNLAHINISNNKITCRSVIIALLSCNQFKLDDVRFSGNDLSVSSNIDRNQSGQILFKHTISSLALDNCSIDFPLFIDLASVIFSPFLTHLYLSYNNIGDYGAMCIAQCSSLVNIQSLYVDNNNITDEGAIALATSQKLLNLTCMNIRSNLFTEDGIIAFATNTLPNIQFLELGLAIEFRGLFEGLSFKCF